jgi:hypothetical protein
MKRLWNKLKSWLRNLRYRGNVALERALRPNDKSSGAKFTEAA